MHIIKNRTIIEDKWQFLDCTDANASYPVASELDDEEQSYTLMDFSIWCLLNPFLRTDVKGIALRHTDKLAIKKSDLKHIEVISIVCESASLDEECDLADQLRKQLQFLGEIRAIKAAAEQVSTLEQSGFNAFCLDSASQLKQAVRHLENNHNSNPKFAA